MRDEALQVGRQCARVPAENQSLVRPGRGTVKVSRGREMGERHGGG
jgi:hypothetical protein